MRTGQSDNNWGLADLRVLPSRVSTIGTDAGVCYSGIPLETVFDSRHFDEITHLLWFQKWPTDRELEGFRARKQSWGSLPSEILYVLQALPDGCSPFHALQAAIPLLQKGADSIDFDVARGDESLFFLAQLESLLVAILHRRRGLDFKYLSPDYPLLDRLVGEEVSAEERSAFNHVRNLYAEHELNAATFAGRVAASTQAKLSNCITTALSTLEGPIHGGAVEKVVPHYQYSSRRELEFSLLDQLARKEKIMGIGHRVYMKKGDPRYLLMKKVLERICSYRDDDKLISDCVFIEEFIEKRIGIRPNLDLAGAPCFMGLGFSVEAFVPLIAISRAAGWCAHFEEQRKLNKIIRPRAFPVEDLNNL